MLYTNPYSMFEAEKRASYIRDASARCPAETRNESGYSKSLVISEPPKDYKGFVIWDFDGTIRKHGSLTTTLCNLLIPSSVNSASPEIKYILGMFNDLVSRVTKGKYYQESIDIARMMHNESYMNVIYTVNNRPSTIHTSLKRNYSEDAYHAIITTDNKTSSDLECKLQDLTRLDKDSLRAKKFIAIGDSVCDLDCIDFSEHHLKIGFESSIGRQKEKLIKKADIFVDSKKRTGEISKDKILEEIGKTFENDPELRDKLTYFLKDL